MFTKSLKLYILLVISPIFATSQTKISLNEAIQLTLNNNLQLKRAAYKIALSQKDVSLSRQALYPILEASNDLNFNYGRSLDPTSYTYVNTGITTSSGGISSNVILFQGLSKINQIRKNKYLLEADKSYQAKLRNDLKLRVVTVYLSILAYTDQLTTSRQQLKFWQERLQQELIFYKAGTKNSANLAQAESEIAKVEFNVISVQNQLDSSLLDLKQLMEMPVYLEIILEKPDVDAALIETVKDEKDIYSKALINFPEIRQAENRQLALERSIALAKSGLYPIVSLRGSLGSNYSNRNYTALSSYVNMQQIGVTASNEAVLAPFFATEYSLKSVNKQLKENFYQYVGFNVRIPIYQGNLARINIEKSRVDYYDGQVALQILKNDLTKVINQALLDARAAEKSYLSARQSFQSSKKVFDIFYKRHNAGLINSIDLNKANNEMDEAEFNMIRSQYDLLFKRKVIDFYLGEEIRF